MTNLTGRLRGLTPLFYRLCPACGCDGLVDNGGGHWECLICGFDAARDEVRTPEEWFRDAMDGVAEEARGLHRLVETAQGWRLTGRRWP